MRIGEPLQIMPLTRRGVIVARLLCQVCLTKAQTPNDEEDRTPFCWYFLFVHVTALCSIINLMQRAYHAITAKRVTKRERSSQTGPGVSTDSGSSQTEGRLVKPSLCVDDRWCTVTWTRATWPSPLWDQVVEAKKLYRSLLLGRVPISIFRFLSSCHGRIS